MYTDLGPTTANALVGMLSAMVDDIPVMFAVKKGRAPGGLRLVHFQV